MVTISNVSSTSTPLVTTVVGTPDTPETTGGTSGTSAPLFQQTLTTQGRLFALGLGAPRNHGDIEALFAEIATKFGVEVGKASNFAEAAEDAKRSTALRGAAGMLAFGASLSSTIQTANFNIARQTVTIASLNQQIGVLQTQRSELVALKTSLEAQKATLDAEMGRVGNLIGEQYTLLNAKEAAKATACGADATSATCGSLTQEVNNIRSQINTLQAEFNSLNSQMVPVLAQINSVNTQIAGIDGQIATLNNQIGAAQNSINASTAQRNTATTLLNFLSVLFLPSSVTNALLIINEMARASFEMTPGQEGLNRAVEDAANNIADQAEQMGKIDALLKSLGQSLPESGPAEDGPVTEAKPTGRLGAIDLLRILMAEIVPPMPESPEAGANGTGAPGPTPDDGAKPQPTMLDLIRQALGIAPPEPSDNDPVDNAGPTDTGPKPAALDLIRQALGPDATTPKDDDAPVGDTRPKLSALELIQQALQTALPPGSGDVETVQRRAGEIAGILALLRGVLGQIANGEAAMTPPQPGPSGRLTLAI